ncbi:DUF4412 domain-containing protein [candidate division KSB1 bacterium]|nr:DUF4412 domain-containing protein [candidate division KSB1 bacterium]
MIENINAVSQLWWQWMSAMFWQVSLLILLITAIDVLIRKWAYPQLRYALWLLVLLKLVLPPDWSSSSSVVSRATLLIQNHLTQQLGIQGRQQHDLSHAEVTESQDRDSMPQNTQPAAISAAPGSISQSSPESRQGGLSWQALLLAIWLLGMVLFSMLLLLKISKLRRWHRQQQARQTIPEWFHELMLQTARRLKLEQLPAIVFSDAAVTPAVYGVFRPVLLLPANYAETLSREQAEHVLLHELAHLKRGDLWLHAFCLLLQIVYWFNPMLIWARKQMKHVREICCDLTIANILREKTTRYRQTLLNTARELLTESVEPGMGLLGVFEEPFRLVARLKWLEKKTWQRRNLASAITGCVIIIMIPLVLPMAAYNQVAPIVSGEGRGEHAQQPGALFESETTHTRLKTVGRREFYFLGIKLSSEVVAETETWIGGRKIAEYAENRIIIVDPEANRFVFANRVAKTYVESKLPLELSTFLSEELSREHGRQKLSGTVAKTGNTMSLLNLLCEEYELTRWQVSSSARQNQRQIRVWATTELPLNLDAFYQMLICLRRIFNSDERLMKELAQIEGIQMRIEFPNRTLFENRQYIEEVVDISRESPPAGIYVVPDGYEQRDHLTRQDLQ